ncbi:MAG: 3-isopropylmalate dehydratase [Acidimicrobiia bacterium]
MLDAVVRGRVWRFDHDISTDLLSPGGYAVEGVDERKLHCLESVNPSFAHEVQPGDVVVTGRNFGCGSSRETAPENLKALGVGCIVAESLSRLFMRNAVAIGLPALVSEGIHGAFADGDEIEVDLTTGRIVNLGDGSVRQAAALPDEMQEILEAGGILAVLRKQFRTGV